MIVTKRCLLDSQCFLISHQRFVLLSLLIENNADAV